MEEVQLRAQQSASSEYTTDSTSSQETETSGDLQEMLDQLRAEIAELRAELKKYRN